jgi:hypothetical protein
MGMGSGLLSVVDAVNHDTSQRHHHADEAHQVGAVLLEREADLGVRRLDGGEVDERIDAQSGEGDADADEGQQGRSDWDERVNKISHRLLVYH